MAYFDVMKQAQAFRKRLPAGAPPANPMFNDTDALAAEQGGQYATAAGYGDSANQSFLDSAQSFDASTALDTYAKGAWGGISDELKKSIAATHGAAVGAGRFDSGFVDEDTNEVYGRATKQLSDAIAQQSIGAAGLQQRNTQMLGEFGQNQQGMAADLLASRREEMENNKREEEERKRKKRSGIGGAIGGVLGGVGGFLVGGPAGAAAGYGIGSKVGSSF